MPRKRLIWRLFPSYLLVTLLSLLALTWYATASWRQFYLEQTEIDLKNRALLVQDYLRGDLSAAKIPEIDRLCKNLGRLTATRLTVILPSGQVLGDSEENPARMENHGDRPEVQAALQGRVGTSGRYSFTLGHDRMYVAIPLKEQDRIVGVSSRSSMAPASRSASTCHSGVSMRASRKNRRKRRASASSRRGSSMPRTW